MSTNESPSPVTTAAVHAEVAVISEEQASVIAGVIGRNWGLLLGFGIILAGLGVAVMVWPHATIGVIAVLLGIAMLISGLFTAIAGFTRSDHPTTMRVLAVASGLISMLLGGLALTGVTQAVSILALMIGFGWIVRGIGDVTTGFVAKGQRGRGLVITSGVLGIVAGVAVLAWPSITLVALAYISGIWLIVLGIVQVVLAFRVRNVRSAEDLRDIISA